MLWTLFLFSHWKFYKSHARILLKMLLVLWSRLRCTSTTDLLQYCYRLFNTAHYMVFIALLCNKQEIYLIFKLGATHARGVNFTIFFHLQLVICHCLYLHLINSQSCQVSRFTREFPDFRADLQVSRWVLKISRNAIKMVLYAWILHLRSEKIQFTKIPSVLSKENPYVFVKWLYDTLLTVKKISSVAVGIQVNLEFVILKYNVI
jgi:hypothetical protein